VRTRAALGLGAAGLFLAAAPSMGQAQTPGTPPDLPVARLAGSGAAVVPASQQPPPSGQLPPLPVTHLEDRSRDLDTTRGLTLSIAEPMAVRELLFLLVRGTPFSVVMTPEVEGTFVGELKDVTLRQAFDAVLLPRGMDYAVDGSIIRVFRRRTDTRFFDLNFLNVQRATRRTIQTDASLGRRGDGSSLTSSAGAGDVFDDVSAGIRTLLSSEGRVHVDRRAGLAQVTDYADRLDTVGAYVEAVHLRVLRQVRLQARVVEVTVHDGHAIDWRSVREKLGVLPGTVATAGMPVRDPAALEAALATQGDVRTIAAPEVLALNNEAAIMRLGSQDVSFAIRGEKGGRESEAVPVAEGLTLTVVPQISSDGVVQLSVSPSWIERTGQTRSSTGDVAPLLNVAEADTVLRVFDGDTVAISGLLRTRQMARPASGFGGLFGAQQHQTVYTELVILMTATVVVPGTPPAERTR